MYLYTVLPCFVAFNITFSQEKVVFVTCEDEDKIANLRSLIGQNIRYSSYYDACKSIV